MSNKDNPKDYTVYMIGNAHIDAAWLWRWTEGYWVAKTTFRSALDRLNEYPDFTFTCSSAVYYKWIEENEPEMFEEIKERVKEGRFCIVGGWWLQPDCNIPCGESLVRQALYGQRYFQSRFGRKATVGYNVDTFGHCGTLPQILSKSGLNAYIFFRPGPHEKELPNGIFWWEASDGSRVIGCRAPHHYGFYGDAPGMERRIRTAAEQSPAPLKDVLCFYGVGDHGGGPTKEVIEAIIKINAMEHTPQVKFGILDDYFAKIKAQTTDYPVVHEDLQHHARGCYSVHSEIKRLNRQSENLLMTAEKFSAIDFSAFGKSYPQEELTRAWQNVLFNQFHDILAGTSIPEVYEDTRRSYDEALNIGTEALHWAVEDIIRRVDTKGCLDSIAVFNPSSWARQDPIEVEFRWRRQSKFKILDSEGSSVPYQFIQTAQTTAGGAIRLVILADVPSLGYQLYRCEEVEEEEKFTNKLTVTPTTMESDYWILEFDPDTGYLSRLFDKRNEVEVLAGDSAMPIVIADPSDTWSHGVDEFRKEVGRFTNAKLTLIEEGPVRAKLRVESYFGKSTIQQDWMIYGDSDRIDCQMSVDWHEQHRMLKLAFPGNVKEARATYEIPYGYIERATNGEEEPGQQWIDVSGKTTNAEGEEIEYGLSLLNDSKYGFDVKDAEMRMSVLRSPIYAFHIPAQKEPGKFYHYIDQGFQIVNYSLVPHPESWQKAKVVKRARALNNPLISILEPHHGGTLPLSKSFLEVKPDNIMVSVVKKAEDSNDLIVRCYETDGEETSAEISIPSMPQSWRGKLKPSEIKTLKFSAKGVEETDLLEGA